MDEGERLYELFLALFRSEPELRRFLALDSRLQPEVLATENGSLAEAASEAARSLQQNGLIDEALFSALERRSPERSKDIDEVARFYGVRGGSNNWGWVTNPTTLVMGALAVQGIRHWLKHRKQAKVAASSGVSPEMAEFARQLHTDLEALEIPDESAQAVDPDHWPWTAAAAVLSSFQPSVLRPLPGSKPPNSALVALADFIFTSFDGQWVLRREIRIPCLERLRDEGRFNGALQANRRIPDLHRDLIRRLLDGWEPTLANLDKRELEAIGVVADWLEPVLGADLGVNRTAINAAAERRLLLDPLRALVGKHFRGRTEELDIIRNHMLGDSSEHFLLVHGPGGIGKSSLMGKVLLDLEAQAALGQPVSFAYVDFDRARNDPNDPIGLLEQVARQLRLLYSTAAEATQFAAVEAFTAGTDLERAAEVLQIGRSRTLPNMVNVLAERLLRVRSQYAPASVPLVLALDTFEEVQIRGPGAVHSVLDLMSRLQEALPEMRVIVSGRAVKRAFGTNVSQVIVLNDLDREAADAVLEQLGVADPRLRREIAERFGRNPLTLRLAADALADADIAEESFAAVVSEANALARVSVELVQGMLYSRILGHIADPDVVKVAYPGLAVRCVTVEVLREVLAEPCGFEPERAEDIFERLQGQVAMFDLDDPETLRHRQDLRRLMLRIMRDEPRQAQVVTEIHGRAAAYYATKAGEEARAEELYHRLMGGEDPRAFGRLWTPSMNPMLASAMEEPLPPMARSWLGRRLGLVSTDEQAEWDQEDWEGDAASRASSWLASNQPTECLTVLSERPTRLEGSRLYALEVAARTALGDLEQAAGVLDRGLRSAIDIGDHIRQLELLEQAITLRARQGNSPGVIDAVNSAVALTDLTDQQARGIRALTDAVSALRELGPDDEVEVLNAEISRRFGRFSRLNMLEQPELVRRVLRTAGMTDSAVLVHAAVEVGDMGKGSKAVFVEDTFTIQRLLDQATSEAQPALAELATEIGLPEERWSTKDLARLAVRYGRVGKAIALGLIYAADGRAARQLVVDGLVLPIEYPSP